MKTRIVTKSILPLFNVGDEVGIVKYDDSDYCKVYHKGVRVGKCTQESLSAWSRPIKRKRRRVLP